MRLTSHPSDNYSTPSSNGAYSTPAMNYVVGAGGVRIGSGIGPYLGINVAVPAPSVQRQRALSESHGHRKRRQLGAFHGGRRAGRVTHALRNQSGGFAGDLRPLFLSPITLGNVQVTINGVAAPIYYVSPTQISAIVPYELSAGIAQVQVITDGNPSNTITMFTNETSVGSVLRTARRSRLRRRAAPEWFAGKPLKIRLRSVRLSRFI
jgi:hypothetical protein